MDESQKKSERRSRILQDHKRVGKKFIPPFLYQIGPLSEVSWVNEILPELIWISLLIDQHGYQRGVDLALNLAQAANKAYTSDDCQSFAWISDFQTLTDQSWAEVISHLNDSGLDVQIARGLKPLISLYPDSPLAPLATGDLATNMDDLALMKAAVLGMYGRREIPATRAQSAAVYLTFIAGCLKVASDTPMADFPEVENYPTSQASLEIAASVRASVNFLYGISRDKHSSDWPIRFWNRGLDLDECVGISEHLKDPQEDG